MSSNKLILILALGTIFFWGLKLGRAAKIQVHKAYEIHETQLEKAMMDLD